MTSDPDRLRRDAVDHLFHWPQPEAEYDGGAPTILVEGRGATVTDLDGREYIDGMSVLGVTQIGHGRADMAEAIAAQARTLEYASLNGGLSNVPAIELAARLAQLTPGELSVSFFTSSGSEAVETALKMARQYHRQRGEPGRTKVVARHGSYHGLTFGALGATGIASFRAPFEPLVPGFVHVPAPYRYRPEELGCVPEEVGRRAAEALEAAIVAEGPETVAAVIAEPIPVPLAVRVPPPDYWPAVRAICDRHGVLLIVDEVFNGFGRTGRLFASEHWGIEPDVLTLAKGITSGYVPLAATVATRAVADAFAGSAGAQFMHGATYAGHPVACAAALKNIEIIEDERLVQRSAELGDRLLIGLSELAGLPFVGDVSGCGLMASVELVSDPATKEPAPPAVGAFLKQRLAELGLLVRYLPNSIYVYPPLVIEPAQVDRIVAVVGQALADAGSRFGSS